MECAATMNWFSTGWAMPQRQRPQVTVMDTVTPGAGSQPRQSRPLVSQEAVARVEGFCEVGEQEREAGTGGLTAQAKCGGEPAEGDEGMGKDGGDESDERGEEALAPEGNRWKPLRCALPS